MNKDYTKYTTEKLLEDDFFIESNTSPTLDTINFWKGQIAGGLDEQEYQLAVFFLRSIRVKKEQMSNERQDLLWTRIKDSNKILLMQRNRRFRSFIWMVAASVTVLIIFSISYIYTNVNKTPDVEAIAREMAVTPEAEDIQLVLPDKQIPISGQESQIEYDAKGTVVVNSEKIADAFQSSANSSKRSLEFNQLIVPNGKRSTLILEDGTKVWVNAGSRIVYPVAFADKKREIYVNGEVFLEVAPDKNRPFVVKTKEMDVQVLGTSFNVMAYETDESASVVLVTGSVQVDTRDDEDFRLEPNRMFSYHKGECDIKDVNVNDYILWKDGLYTYRSEHLSVILDRLSRYYGKKISYKSDVADLRCSGKLDMQEDLEVVLDGLSQTAPILYKKIGEEYILVKVGK
ncbi:FecR domain-containing protein [Parabacteroides faecis]|uniref:FecR family protein n=1 Tax=Parabacteroides faecis TaxID=1217282 RepID=UPI0021643215|nr:FecR domain-containing protein [Parabacteroides faecis]MCS2890887.1 FecR domain-containing protein [Parabacteroides faecis]UVQ45456.1 FecR domain-containing protein [Parabacteroides faecis]